MKKTAFTFLALAFTTVAFSQTVDDGIKFIYYGKTKSAIGALEKVVAAKPKDALSIYWLGQAYIEDYGSGAPEQLAKAKTLYQQALQGGVNDPWIWVGSGHVTVLEGGDINAAKQQFEQAITSTKGKKGVENADILNAVGRAMADGDSKHGDAQYAVDKLKRAAEIDIKNPDIDINLGTAYSKMGSEHGGDAVQAFTDATVRDPKYAAGYTKIGHIYQSQDNKGSMEEWYGKAIGADDQYGQVYYWWFTYYRDKDVNLAKEYLDKYVARADKDCATAYFQADYLFRAGKYQESLTAGQAMEAGECKTYPRLNILYAYNYDRLGDSIKAKDYLQKFFASSTGKVDPDYYVLAGNVYRKVAGFEDSAVTYLVKAMDEDTVQRNKIKYADTIRHIYSKVNNHHQALIWEQKLISLKPAASNRDLYDLEELALADSALTLADSVLTVYKTKYPDQAYAYVGAIKLAQKMDTTGAKAVGPEEDYIGFLMKDTVKNGQVIAYYHALIGGYFTNFAKNLDSAVAHFQQAMQYDPANEQYKKYYDILYKAQQKKKNPQAAAPAADKPAGTKPKQQK